ncbi:MAG: TIGR02996 domain-containing protein [Deltaproteobacteria bacterium]|nr:TIGR02996 domain-containing protein [Deltaproteobacteria bacterium]
MLDSGEALMREIRAQPDDDAPRIVYADWLLQSSTDPDVLAHAELIHAQCALEHASERPALQVRVKEILRKYRRIWTSPLTRANIRGNWRFRRGFLHGGTLTAARFVDVAAQLFELAPMVRSMIFPEASNELVRLAQSPYLAHLHEVHLDQLCRCGRCKIERELPELFASPHTVNIHTLTLADCRIDPDNAKRLFESRHLPKLRVLDLHDNRLDVTSAQALAARGGTFERLVLAANPIGTDGARALAQATSLVVADLDLASCGIEPEGGAALAEASWAESITSLDLHDNRIGKGVARGALRTRFGRRVKL